MGKIYTITSAGTASDGPDLLGLQIRDIGNGYELVKVLATSTSKNLPVSFTFQGYDGWNWTVTATGKTDPPPPQPPTLYGRWVNNDNPPRITGEEDGWTATGTGNAEDEDEAQSASA